jgi:hypothetical protein
MYTCEDIGGVKKQPSSCFSPGTPASSTTKTGCHDIAEILLKVALKHQKTTNQKLEYLEKNNDHRQSTGKLYQIPYDHGP